MKAIAHEQYGSPEVLRVVDVATPVPEDDEVLIQVRAAAANPLDWHKMRASPFFVRLTEGLRKPKRTGLGADVAGQVVAVGRKVTQFKVGEDVFGDVGTGGFAEFVCAKEAMLTHKPANVSYENAAATPVAALTALQGLRDHGRIKANQTVLINGASGGVGTYAVQLAKQFGATVTGVCSTRNLELVKRLGAKHVIDYTVTDFTSGSTQYDLIFDAVGNCSAAQYKRALTPEGTAVVAGFTTLSTMVFQVVMMGGLSSKLSKQRIMSMLAAVNQNDLAFIAALLEEGNLSSVIDTRYPLEKTAEAIAYLEQGHARGKVIIQISTP